MNRQCTLHRIRRGAREKQPPGIENRPGAKKNMPLFFDCATHRNKGKSYPYGSHRQGFH